MPGSIDKTVVYALCVSPLSDESLYEKIYNNVSRERQIKTDKFRFEKDRYLSLGAEALLRYALREEGVGEELPETVYGENGKPYFKDSDIHFNISHSGDYVVCALSPFETGCDIEKKSENGLKVAGRFAKREYDDIMSKKTDEEKTELFYRYWTLKEGYMKATGLGMRLALDSFEIVREEIISVIRDGIPEDCSFTEFDDIDGYACSVCVMRAEAGKAVLRTVDIEKIIRGWHL